jgi:hypothetical protein
MKDTNKEQIKRRPPTTTIDQSIFLKPWKPGYVIRTGFGGLIVTAIGIGYKILDPDVSNAFIVFTMALGIFTIINAIRLCFTTSYEIARNGIHIRSGLFKPHIDLIIYPSIYEVKHRQAFYEKRHNVGTVLLDIGETDNDGDIEYTKLIGIRNHKEIAKLIGDQAGLEQD